MTPFNTEIVARDTVPLGNTERFVEFAAAGLSSMYCPESQLFCYSRKLNGSELVNEGVSYRYTAMTLLGLVRYEASGRRAPIDTRLVLRSLLAATERTDSLGDLGLLLWLCADADPNSAIEACRGRDLQMLLERSPDARQGKTMELAWFLAGLAHLRLSNVSGMPLLADAASEVYRLLIRNQGPHGLFGHSATRASLQGMVRGRIGSFADQVYPIYALAKFGHAYEVPGALESARTCAEAICRAQGPSGQWWWHYDARTGRVVERYPVYSVHQHGMGPMALLALEAATGADFSEFIYKGLRWVSETNEMHRDLADEGRRLIWRCIYPPPSWRTAPGKASMLVGREDRTRHPKSFRIRFECRPYELGWLLYAFGGCNSGGRG